MRQNQATQAQVEQENDVTKSPVLLFFVQGPDVMFDDFPNFHSACMQTRDFIYTPSFNHTQGGILFGPQAAWAAPRNQKPFQVMGATL